MPSEFKSFTPQTQEDQPSLYSISVAEFRVAPKELKPYHPGDVVNRDNFINFLIYCFAVSRGKAEVQIIFMWWLKLKNGFDYSTVLRNLNEAGGWKIFSEDEKRVFKGEFGKVSKHTEQWEEDKWESIIGAEIERIGGSAQGMADAESMGEVRFDRSHMENFLKFLPVGQKYLADLFT